MSELFVTSEEESAVKGLLTKGLAVGPKHSTADVLAKAKAKRRSARVRILAASIAAVLVLSLYATSPLVIPALARALSAVPVVGPSFEQALKLHSLDLAYEAGLLTTLDKSMERDGVTVTVHSAYRDSHTFEVLLSVGGGKEFVKSLADSIGPRVVLNSGRVDLGGYYSSRLYDEEQNRLYVSLSSFRPLPWYVRKLEVSVAWMTDEEDIRRYVGGVVWDSVELSEPMAVSFPLQRITDEHTTTVPIDQTIVSGESTVNLENLVFNPIRTILRYSYTGPMPVLDLYDENGEQIRAFVGETEPREAYHTCAATTSEEIVVRVHGHFVNYEVEVPLEEGYEYAGEPAFRIESITPTNKPLESLTSNGREYIADTKVVLGWDKGDWHSVHTPWGDAELDADTVTLYLVRQGQSSDEPLTLTFSRLEGEPQEVKITR